METKIMVAAIVVLAIIATTAFALTKTPTAQITGDVAQNADYEKEFNVKAFRFGYEPNEITVNLGDKVKIKVENTDTLHGIRIPDLNVKGMDSVEFVAEKKGEFSWRCNSMCGEGHMKMSGKLIVK